MAKITRQDIVSKLALHNRLGSNAAASEVLDELLSIVTEEVSAGNEVYLGQSFGGFKPGTQSARTARVPGTDKTVDVPAKQVIKFKPSSKLKQTVAS